jgi:hypothetical protein
LFNRSLLNALATDIVNTLLLSAFMANLANLTEKLSELSIKNAETSSASTSTSKLPTKFQGAQGTAGRPPPGAALKLLSSKSSNSIFTPPTTISSTINASTSTLKPTEVASPSDDAAAPGTANAPDIGTYDGGFESEMDEGRGKEVNGEAAEDLALDSSKSR